MTYLFFFLLVLIVTALLIIIAAYIGTFFVKIFNTFEHARFKRKLSIFGYQCYYLNYKSMENDANCMRLIPILRDVYIKGSKFNAYCPRLSEERLPLNVMMNWARSITEDLFIAPIPSVKLDQWKHYWKSKIYMRVTFFHSDFPEYEDFELGCLWGVVYLWLTICYEKDPNDLLLKKIVQIGCKEKTAIPYFFHFYNAIRQFNGKDYYLPFSPYTDFDKKEHNFSNNPTDDFISSEDVFSGFESLSVNERCNARKVLNDVLSDCFAWRSMCNEMKSRGWFKETIYPVAETKMEINGDFVLNKKVEYEVANVESGSIGVNNKN